VHLLLLKIKDKFRFLKKST